MTNPLPAAAINAAECIAHIEASRHRPTTTVTPEQVKRTVALYYNLGIAEGDAWDAWIASLQGAAWAR